MANSYMTSKIKKLVSGATFTFRTKKHGNGQCVLIQGGLLITAAHCVDWDCSSMATGAQLYLHRIKTPSAQLIASTVAVEPVSDIAILASPEGDDELFEASEAFQEFCDRTTPLKLLLTVPEPRIPFPVWIRTHVDTWIAGKATYRVAYSGFSYTTQSEVPSGTSGGPIVNESGELVGVVSYGTTTKAGSDFYSAAGLLPLALPAWVIARASQ